MADIKLIYHLNNKTCRYYQIITVIDQQEKHKDTLAPFPFSALYRTNVGNLIWPK